MNRREVSERLGHLLATDIEHGVVHPVTSEGAASGDCFCSLVGVVGEDQIVAAAVDVEVVVEYVEAHRGALDVPAGPSWAPGRIPSWFARLGRLPQCEVERIFLGFVALDAGDCVFGDLIGASMNERSVVLN